MTYLIETDPARFDLDRVIPFIQASYWGQGRRAKDIRASFDGSAVVGLFDGDTQLGMARAITDGVFAAYVFDLFVFEEHRGQGHAHRLIEALFDHPDLRRVQAWMLSTKDAHELYARYGFEVLPEGRVMRMAR